MEITTLLADPEAIRVQKIVPDNCSLTLVVRTTPTQAQSPRCHLPSARVHSYYTRTVADLPWRGVAVRLHLRTRCGAGGRPLPLGEECAPGIREADDETEPTLAHADLGGSFRCRTSKGE